MIGNGENIKSIAYVENLASFVSATLLLKMVYIYLIMLISPTYQ